MEFQENSVLQELIKKLFPNKENIVINDELTIEVKYDGLTSYTPDYIKQTVKDAYGAWSENFYSQKSNHTGPVKLQLYVLKNYDDYKAYIKELSGGKDHNELWGGGTVRAHKNDGTIAKTFIIGDINSLLCAKSKILMEKMSDAFLEYATGNLNEVPEVLRTGMKLFMWSYDAAKKESIRDMHYTKEVYDKMQESGYNTPYKIASMTNNYRMADCLVTFLQEKHPQFIKQLFITTPFGRAQAISEFKRLLDNSEIEKEFKQWMDVKSGNKTAADLVPDSEVITFSKHKLQINLKYDNEELNHSKLSGIKNAIEGTIKDFDSVFGINNSQPWHNILNKINVFIFNTKSDYESYLKELSIGYQGNSGLTLQGRGSDVHVYFYLQNEFNDSCKTLKHELGHALTIINSYYGTGSVLPKAMHEGIANYMAGLGNGQYVNDHGDKEALIAIRNKDLKPDKILCNNIMNNKWEHYNSDTEQVIKFLEDKHPDMIDNLLKSLSTHGTSKPQGNKLVENFLAKLKDYDQEFKQWVKVQLSGEEYLKREHEVSSTQEDKAEYPTNEKRKRSKRSLEEDEDKREEVVITSVIYSMKGDKEEDYPQYPLKIKTGEPIEMGKYKVKLQVTYDDVKNFCDIVRNKYHMGKEYNYEQVMVLYNEIVSPAHNHHYEPFTLDKAYVADNHLFIKDQDFGTLDDFNEMFYKSDELV
ncbi:collagenase [Wolbachia endosymbiont of Mansonella ozzardi]|nr:collagenase [Wolbachia endosymbiont of Mansonella ozzardi]